MRSRERVLCRTLSVLYSMSGRRQEAKTLMETFLLADDADEEGMEEDAVVGLEAEHMEAGSLEEAREPLLDDMAEGMGLWAQEPVEPKLASKLTSEPELWEHSSEERLCEM